jgi:hypothetical protein
MLRRLLFLTAGAALALGACSSSTPSAATISDPKAIVSQSVLSMKDVKNFHFLAAVSGTINVNLTGSGAGSTLDLKGTTAEGDADLAGKNYHVAFSAPALFGISGDVIVIGDTTYTKISIISDKYTKSTAGASDPVASAATDPQTIVDDVNKALSQPGVTPTLVGNEPCGDQTCYHVSIKLSSSDLQGAIGSAAPSALSGLTGNATVDVWSETNDLRPVKIVIAADLGTQGNLSVTVTLSAYNGSVTIAPPPDSQIDTSSSQPSEQPSAT